MIRLCFSVYPEEIYLLLLLCLRASDIVVLLTQSLLGLLFADPSYYVDAVSWLWICNSVPQVCQVNTCNNIKSVSNWFDGTTRLFTFSKSFNHYFPYLYGFCSMRLCPSWSLTNCYVKESSINLCVRWNRFHINMLLQWSSFHRLDTSSWSFWFAGAIKMTIKPINSEWWTVSLFLLSLYHPLYCRTSQSIPICACFRFPIVSSIPVL